MTDQSDDIDIAAQRSPKYPYIALDKALERVTVLNAQVRDTSQTREVMARAYGKPASSSATIQTFATLNQYGLLEPVLAQGGQRKLRVTQLARSILHPNAPSDVVNNGRKIAALKPKIFKEIWDAYGSTAGLRDGVVLYYLTQDREKEHGTVFTEKAAHEVLRVYRSTLEFAGLMQDGEGGDSNAVIDENVDADEVGQLQEIREGTRLEKERATNFPVPQSNAVRAESADERELQAGLLSKIASYRVLVRGPIGVREIERLIRKLEMDKEILADEPDDLRDILS
jgi:hypothetical protein